MQFMGTLVGRTPPCLLGFEPLKLGHWVFMLAFLLFGVACSSNEPRDFEPADFAGFQPKTLSQESFQELVGDFLATADNESSHEKPDLQKIRRGAEMIEAALLKADSLASARHRSEALRLEVILLAAEFPQRLDDNRARIEGRLAQFIEHLREDSRGQEKPGMGTSL